MKLKEIKPNMIIHCKNDDEKRMLYDELCRMGVMDSGDSLDSWENFISRKDVNYEIYMQEKGEKILLGFTISPSTVELSNFIIPELSAEEVLQIMREMPFDFIRDYLECNIGYTREELLKIATNEQLLGMCAKWKSSQNREPEAEWFWQGRIFKIYEDGNYYQIKDGTGFYDTGCEYRESAEEFMADELKEYCKTHDGDYIATVEHVCRIKSN